MQNDYSKGLINNLRKEQEADVKALTHLESQQDELHVRIKQREEVINHLENGVLPSDRKNISRNIR